MRSTRRRSSCVAALGVALLLGSGCGAADLNPVERDESRAGIEIRVVECAADEGTGNVTMTFEVQSEREYDVVLVEGRLRDGSGVVVGSSTGSVQNVAPGETYREEMILSPSGEIEGELECEAMLDLATEPFG